MIRRRTILAAPMALAALPAAAQQGRALRLVVPAAPGGAIDVIGRLYAQAISARQGQAWVVENRSGANNTIGAAEVARAAPDGQTLLTNADIQLMAKLVMRSVPYDPITDFTPIARLAVSPLVLVGHPERAPAGDLGALVAAMRVAPDRYSFANSALGAMGHLATESLKQKTGLPGVVVVSYRGTAPALTDTVGGQTALMVAPLGSALGHVRAGRLRAYGVFSASRSAAAPEIPTVAEGGMAGLVFTLWYGLWGPRGMAAEQVGMLNEAVREAGRGAELILRLAALGAEPVDEDATSFARFIAAEVAANAAIAKAAGIEPE